MIRRHTSPGPHDPSTVSRHRRTLPGSPATRSTWASSSSTSVSRGLAGTIWGLLLSPFLLATVAWAVIQPEEKYLESKFDGRLLVI